MKNWQPTPIKGAIPLVVGCFACIEAPTGTEILSPG